MSLGSIAIRRILESEGLPAICGPHGFDLPVQFGFPWPAEYHARLERGSGIAGRGYHWHIVGSVVGVTPSVTTAKELRRLLREWRTGEPKPQPRPGYITYAKLNRNQYGEAYVWMTRRISKPSKPL